jgi:hypothetical protein
MRHFDTDHSIAAFVVVAAFVAFLGVKLFIELGSPVPVWKRREGRWGYYLFGCLQYGRTLSRVHSTPP